MAVDTVALLKRAERPDTDIAFTLEFTKSRERAPHNRSDFASVTIILKDDQWQIENATFKAQTKPPSPLGRKFYDALQTHSANTANHVRLRQTARR